MKHSIVVGVRDELKATFGPHGSCDRMPVSWGYTIAEYPVLHSPLGGDYKARGLVDIRGTSAMPKREH